MVKKMRFLILALALSVSTTGCALMRANKEQLKEFAADTAIKTGEKLAASIEKNLKKQVPPSGSPSTPKELLAIVGLYAIAEGRKWLRDRKIISKEKQKDLKLPEPA